MGVGWGAWGARAGLAAARRPSWWSMGSSDRILTGSLLECSAAQLESFSSPTWWQRSATPRGLSAYPYTAHRSASAAFPG